MSAALLPLQGAIKTALDAALATAGPSGAAVPVLDHVPQGTTYPYVQLGDDAAVTDFSAVVELGEAVDFHVHIWSQYRGKAEALGIAIKVKAALQDVRLTVAGWHIAGLRLAFSTIFTEPDGLTRHAVQRYRVLLRKAN